MLSHFNESEIRENISKSNKIDGSLIFPHKTLENEPKLNVIYANCNSGTQFYAILYHDFKKT